MRGHRSCFGSIGMRRQYNKGSSHHLELTPVNPGQQEIICERKSIRVSLLHLRALVATYPTDPDIRQLADRRLKALIEALDDLNRIEIFGTLFEGPPEGMTATEVTATEEIPQVKKLGLFSRK